MLKSLFASIFTVIFNVFFLLSFLLFVVLSTVLNADFYKGTVSEKFYETTVDVVSSVISKQKDEMGWVFTEGDLKQAIIETVTEKDFEDTLIPFIGQIIEPKFDENGSAAVVLDLSNILGKLPNFVGNLAGKLFDTLPECGKNEMPTEKNLCIPNNVSSEDFEAQMMSVLDSKFLSSIPTKTTVFEFREQDLKVYGDMKLNKDLLWNVWWMSVAINVLLLLIIALIILKPWNRILRWISKPLISGAIFVSMAFIALYHLPEILTKFIGQDAMKGALGSEEFDSILYFIGDFFKLISTRALMAAGVMFVLGLSIYIVGLYLKHHSDD